MFACNIKDVERHDYLSENFKLAYKWLAETDLDSIEVGSYPLNDDVTANVQEYTTAPASEHLFETHDEFYDIQYLISGIEAFGVCEREGLTPKEYHPEMDIVFYEEPEHASMLVMHPGDLIVVPCEQAHKPRCSVDGDVFVRKVVVKVRA